MATAVEVLKLVKVFGEVPALKNVNLKIMQGESVALLGPNGAGKSTLIKILATILSPSSGSVWINGRDPKKEAEAVRRQIGVIGHQTYLYNDLTVQENLEFYCHLYGIAKPRERINELAGMVSLGDRLHHRVGTLSRGMQQRASIARSLLHSPQIMLLDEPETGLDRQALTDLWCILRAEPKKTVIFSTHNLERSLYTADRVIILARGRVVYETPTSVIESTELNNAYQEATAP